MCTQWTGRLLASGSPAFTRFTHGTTLLVFPFSGQNIGHRVVAFVAGVLVDNVVVKPGHRSFYGPRLRVNPVVLDRELVVDPVRTDTGEALHCPRVRRGQKPQFSLVTIVPRLNHERVPLPVRPGIAVPLPDRTVELRSAIDRNHSNVMDILNVDGHNIGRLEDVYVLL